MGSATVNCRVSKRQYRGKCSNYKFLKFLSNFRQSEIVICSMPKTRELQVFERIQIYTRRMDGKSLQQIAVEFGISEEGVRKICAKLKNTGKPENIITTGRKGKTSARQDRQIVKEGKKCFY
ncbi:uncharacterized protein LOC143352232 isoform X1 [Halictus rubicundus]|uniref:uncharacterized protein LOC143352232 isoform X1 n=1 Tax=Halictus rubicundus TaxID=77578 RepID=UPI004035B151